MTIALTCLVAIAALFYTLAVRPQDVPAPIPASPIQHLEDRKYAIYDNLRDLQFEYRLGKLSDSDYQATKQALQRELAAVLAETEETVKRLGLATARTAAKPVAKKASSKGAKLCPHCGAKFPTPLKFCGECGKAIV
jgi:rRNA maturation endonuclease Nob1